MEQIVRTVGRTGIFGGCAIGLAAIGADAAGIITRDVAGGVGTLAVCMMVGTVAICTPIMLYLDSRNEQQKRCDGTC